MATPVLISEQEYLRSTFRPDCDLVEGEVLERNVGEQQHSAVQNFLALLFGIHRRSWGVRSFPEQRIQVAPGRYRIADLCVLPLGFPPEPVIRSAPPLLCIEILSASQTLWDLRARAEDYARMGVRQVWVLDPGTRRGYVWTDGDFVQVADGILSLPETRIELALEELWADLDDLQAGN